MISNDRKEKERSDSKNAVEEYVYDMRSKLDGGQYEKYADDRNRQKLLNDLRATENWLYNEGTNQDKNVYIERLKSLKVQDIKYTFFCSFNSLTIFFINSLDSWRTNS